MPANSIPKIKILNVIVSCLTRSDLVELVVKWAKQQSKTTFFYANAHTLNLAYENPGYMNALNQADVVFADGMSVVWAANFLYQKKIQKATSRQWFEPYLRRVVEENQKVFILAGRPGVSEQAKNNIQIKLPGLQIVGTHHGYFNPEDNPEIIRTINNCRPDVVIVGLGSPHQEFWIAEHRNEIYAPVCLAIGAYFDYQAGLEKFAPEWISRLGFEWLWRLMMDPGKWRRYLLGNPKFVLRVCGQLLKTRMQPNR